MTKRTWNQSVAADRIVGRLSEVADIDLREYVRDTDLTSLPTGRAYRVDGVHMYVDILNLKDMLDVTNAEGVTCHRRTLRFLNLHYRAVSRILEESGAILVDFHNQRLHAVVAKPYGDEAGRVYKAVAVAQLISDVLSQTGEDEEDPLPAAKVRVGIDSGKALAVNNGRRGHREPLFLGPAANNAAKRAAGGLASGIFMTNVCRAAASWAAVDDEDREALSDEQISDAQAAVALGVTVDHVLRAWRSDLAANPIGKFEFFSHTPPFSNLDLELLTPSNSRRQECVSLYADIDGFTNYVSRNIEEDEKAKDVVRSLHVLRSELDAVLADDFAGRKIRFIGDCVHGVIVEGTAANTDCALTLETAVLCSGGLRSSFDLALQTLRDDGINVEGLGLAIGVEYGPVAISRLGIKGEMIRCCISRSVLESEAQQRRCNGEQTAIGACAKENASPTIAGMFGSSSRRTGLTYEFVRAELDKKVTSQGEAKNVSGLGRTAVGVAGGTAAYAFPAAAAGPTGTKPAGFA